MELLKWLYPGINIKRWIALFFTGIIFSATGLLYIFRNALSKVVLDLLLMFIPVSLQEESLTLFGFAILFLGIVMMILGLRGFAKSLADIFVTNNGDKIIDVIFSKRRLVKGAAVTVVGGGTGLSTLIRGIKQITSNCTAVVAVTDDGGSSGRLREEFGIIPPGDLRNCLIALADTEPLMGKLMQHRFDERSSLGGHSFGNLFIAAMAETVGNMEKGLNATSKILKVRGRVMPSTLESVCLRAKMSDGSIVEGETNIVAAGKKIEKVMLEPANPVATRSAVDAIVDADIIVFGPGSLYTSVITNLLLPEIRDAVLRSKGIKVYICNVMTQPGETDGYSAYDHVKAIYDHVGEYFFDFIIVNKQGVKQDLLDKYASKGAYPVKNDNGMIMAMGASVVEANLISEHDLVRHDPVKLAKTIIALMYRLRLPGNGLKIFDYYFVKESMRKVKKVLEGE